MVLSNERASVQQLKISLLVEDRVNDSKGRVAYYAIIIAHVDDDIISLAVVFSVLELLAIVSVFDVLDELELALVERIFVKILVHLLTRFVVVKIEYFIVGVGLGQ